ncbi:glycoside hydrolase family 3 C-terminal domain-containing protein [Streptomyces sp. 130]|uniref:glycoside hydrolase family 3 C-terminal domain-containing protein n=1 Tax=Streptomyces sp. 130 TaxID=2591006 RepID=UPI0021B0B379|nr:glycoside hydrolase family 3 C-terminal domain-containing protein [Streptomyces sp. 130]
MVLSRDGKVHFDEDSYKILGDWLTEVAAANPRTIVVLNTDGPVAMLWLDDVEAVIQAWYGGQGMGTALAREAISAIRLMR